MRPQPLISVEDVESTSRWYQKLLGCQSGHGGSEYERLIHGEELILQLHRWDVDHHHGAVGDPDNRSYGNGVLLWFEIDDLTPPSCVPTSYKRRSFLPHIATRPTAVVA